MKENKRTSSNVGFPEVTARYWEKQGYTDAFYGKDFLISVPKQYRLNYLYGQNKFHKEFIANDI
jgi:hypothetical protein